MGQDGPFDLGAQLVMGRSWAQVFRPSFSIFCIRSGLSQSSGLSNKGTELGCELLVHSGTDEEFVMERKVIVIFYNLFHHLVPGFQSSV